MNLRELRQYLDQLSSSLVPEEGEILEARLQGLVSVFPFSEYEFILMFLRDSVTVVQSGAELFISAKKRNF